MEIEYRHEMDRAPTPEDRRKKLGFEEFTAKLQEEGWVGLDGVTSLKEFEVRYSDHAEEGNNYVKWRATLLN